MEIIIAEPVNFNDKQITLNLCEKSNQLLITIINNDNGVSYIHSITSDNIPVARFTIINFYKLLNDIIVNKIPNSKFNLKFKDNQCYCYCELHLKDYLDTEYIFTLLLKPIEEITEVKILKHQIKILGDENNRITTDLDNFKYNTFKNSSHMMYVTMYMLEKYGLNDDGRGLYNDICDIYSMIQFDWIFDIYNFTSINNNDAGIGRDKCLLRRSFRSYDPSWITNVWKPLGYISILNKNEYLLFSDFLGSSYETRNITPIGIIFYYTKNTKAYLDKDENGNDPWFIHETNQKKIHPSTPDNFYPFMKDDLANNVQFDTINIDFDVIMLYTNGEKKIITNIKYNGKLEQMNGMLYFLWKDRIDTTKNTKRLYLKNNLEQHKDAYIYIIKIINYMGKLN